MKLIIRIFIITFSVILAVVLYTHFYSLELADDSLVAGINKRVEGDVNVNDYINLEKYVLVNFTFLKEESTYEGYITLLKGVNDKYRLGNGYFEPVSETLVFSDLELSASHNLIVFGPSPLSERITIKSNVTDISMEINNPVHTFEVLESNVHVASIYGYTYESGSGTEEIKRDNTIKPIIDHSGELNSGPEQIVLLSSLLVVLIGLVLSFMFTPERNRLERLYYKITKQEPEITESDCNDYMMLH